MNSFIKVNSLNKLIKNNFLFEDVSFHITGNQKIALLGANGAGKSTLLKILSKEEKDYDGNVVISGKVGYLSQVPKFKENLTVLENIKLELHEVFNTINRYKEISDKIETHGYTEELANELTSLTDTMENINGWDIESKINTAMNKLDCPDKNLIVSNLSEGQRRRVALCALLMQKNDILILDEPTNHLDIAAINWLEEYLKKFNGILILVSHKRSFINNIATSIYEIKKKLFIYNGKYSTWLSVKAKQEEIEEVEQASLKKAILKEQAWVDSSPKARTTKSKSRLNNFEEMVKNLETVANNVLKLPFVSTSRLGSSVIKFTNLSKKLDDRYLIRNLSGIIPNGAIVGIIGNNGVGKSTLLKMLYEKIKHDVDNYNEGKIEVGSTVRLTYIPQKTEFSNENHSIWAEISDQKEYIKVNNENSRSSGEYVSMFNFRGKDQEKLIKHTSGGERNRIHLAKYLKEEANVIFLDEPTNDLDMETTLALEEGISNFPGVLLIVSHDLWFLNKLCTHYLIFTGNGEVEYLETKGDIEQYINKKLER